MSFQWDLECEIVRSFCWGTAALAGVHRRVYAVSYGMLCLFVGGVYLCAMN